jgi:archaellum component FlaF (FlaF/FlaG flagellin family)
MFLSTVTGSGLAYLAKIPPQPIAPEQTRRDGFIPVTLSLKPPAGLANVDNAVVEFGYLENGGAGDYYCTSRLEACVKGSQPGNAYGWSSDTIAGQPCNSGCTIAIPLIPDRMAYFRVKYRDSANTVLAIGETGIAGETGVSVLKSPGQVRLAPETATLGPGQTQHFSLQDDLGSVGATWLLTPSLGSISADGTYTAPDSLTANETVTVTAYDASNPQRSANATIALRVPRPVLSSVSPATAAQGTSVALEIAGAYFVPGASVTIANPGIAITGVTVVSSTRITATAAVSANAAPGNTTIRIATVGGESDAFIFAVTLGAVIRVNAGGPACDAAGASWTADTNFSGGTTWSGADIEGIPAIYRSGRSGDSFAYSFAVPNGSYTVVLRFAEVTQTRLGERLFNVSVNSAPLLTNFDILAASSGIPMMPADRAFPVAVSGGNITIQFSKGTAGAALVNAIEILPLTVTPASGTVKGGASLKFTSSVPAMWSVDPAAGTISSTGSFTAPATVPVTQTVTVTASGVANPAARVSVPVTLQPASGQPFSPIRINAGGPAYTESPGRIWHADTGFSGGMPESTSLPVSGTTMSPVMQAVRYGISEYALTVPNGFYTVKLYFAEISETGAGQRIFNVRLNGSLVLSNFDVCAAAGGPFKAIVRAFPVSVTGGVIRIQFQQGTANLPMVSAIEIN